MEFRNKKILVIGLARSGLAAIKLLHAIGVEDITLTEQKEVKEREWLESIGVTILPQSDEVFSRPYDIVIKNPGVPPISPFIRKFRDRGIPVITEIELAFCTAKPQHYIGITGTNGKTTTTTLVYEMLKKAFGDKAHVGGNIGIPLSEVVLENNLLNEEGHYISLELSNMQLIESVELRPEIATIVNLTPDHVDFMGGLDNYYYSKTRIYKNMSGSDMFILNADDPAMRYGMLFLRILCIGAPFSALAYTFISFFQAVGHGGESFLLALLRKGILDIPLMFILIRFMSFYGPVSATPIADIICSAVSVILFCTFASKHLKKNKSRKIYNSAKGCYEVEAADGIH